VAARAASGDDAARFLSELRQLRDGAGLGRAELAARAHYPYDSISAAEAGPALPDLPVLSAYVRACGGTTEEWEERWRSLTRSQSLPVSAVRDAGRSDAATAGARIGSVSQVVDSPDPSVIIAALNRVAEEMASPTADAVPTSPAAAQSVPDFAPPAASFPSEAEPYPSVAEPKTSDKPAGWDPIRVSSAWPTLRDLPTAAATASATGFPDAAGADTAAPWEAAPWGTDPLDAASPATGAVGWGGVGSGAADSAAVGLPTASARSAAPISRAGRSSSRTRVVVLAAVLLCVIGVLLAIFA
jgi:hypothetical protein